MLPIRQTQLYTPTARISQEQTTNACLQSGGAAAAHSGVGAALFGEALEPHQVAIRSSAELSPLALSKLRQSDQSVDILIGCPQAMLAHEELMENH